MTRMSMKCVHCARSLSFEGTDMSVSGSVASCGWGARYCLATVFSGLMNHSVLTRCIQSVQCGYLMHTH